MEWERAAPPRLSRRRLLALATGGVASATLAACGDKKPASTATAATPGTRGTAGASPTAGPSAPAARPAFETLRYAGFVADDGQFDPHKTQSGPLIAQQSSVYSRLLTYVDQREGRIVPDLAAAMPEQTDAQTLIFAIRPGARWHESTAPPAGRLVTAEDVKYSIERQRDGSTSFAQKVRWQLVEKVETPSSDRVVVTMKGSLAIAVPMFADVTSFIVAPELGGDANGGVIGVMGQAGSGPFQFGEWNAGKSASLTRNAGWHGGDGRPRLGGIELIQARNASEVEALLTVKKLDAASLGRPQAAVMRANIPELRETTVGQAQFFGMRFYLPQYPYKDVRFRNAITLALDRREMIGTFFAGSGAVNPWVSWPLTRWALPETELEKLAGYRPGEAGRAADIAEAKAQLAAFMSQPRAPEEEKALQQLNLFVTDTAEAAVGVGSLIQQQLTAVLGLNVQVFALTAAELSERVLRQQAPWIAAPENGPLDLDDWVYPYFHSAGTKNTMAVRDVEMDSLIAAQRAEFDGAKRQAIGYQVQRKIWGVNAAVNFASERLVVLAWPYVKDFPADATDGFQDRFASTSIDATDASIRGRP